MTTGPSTVSISVASNIKYVKVLSAHLLLSQSLDKHIFLRPNNDPYVGGHLRALEIEHPGKFEVIELPHHKGGLEARVLSALDQLCSDKDAFYIYLDESICYVHPNAVSNLVNFAQAHPEYVAFHPAIVNTERTTYLYQVIQHLKPWLTKWWDITYIDDISFQKTLPEFHRDIHDSFIQCVKERGVQSLDFGHYNLTPKDIAQTQAFGWFCGSLDLSKSSTLAELITSAKNAGCIVGSSIMSLFSYPQHQKWLEKTDLLEQYKDLSEANQSLNQLPEDDAISEFDHSLPIGALFNTHNEEFQINFAISCHVSTEFKTLPVLLPSLYSECKIPKEQILVVIGGASRNRVVRKDGILHSYVTHNSFDHNALIDIAEKGWGGDWWFMLHDTAKAGPEFFSKVMKAGPKADHVCVLYEGWLNMGLFSRKSIDETRKYIVKLKNLNKMQAILSEKLYPRMIKAGHYDTVPNMGLFEKGDIYGDGVERQVLYFPLLDLYKYQSFHYASEATKRTIQEWIVKEKN